MWTLPVFVNNKPGAHLSEPCVWGKRLRGGSPAQPGPGPSPYPTGAAALIGPGGRGGRGGHFPLSLHPFCRPLPKCFQVMSLSDFRRSPPFSAFAPLGVSKQKGPPRPCDTPPPPPAPSPRSWGWAPRPQQDKALPKNPGEGRWGCPHLRSFPRCHPGNAAVSGGGHTHKPSGNWWQRGCAGGGAAPLHGAGGAGPAPARGLGKEEGGCKCH